MEVKFDIPDAKLEGFTNGAKDRLKKLAEKYAVEIVDEAGRLEFSERQGDASKDITDSQVLNAEKNCRTIIRARKVKRVLSIVSDLSILVFGVMFSFDRFMNEEKKPNVVYILIILIVLIVAITTTVLKYVRED